MVTLDGALYAHAFMASPLPTHMHLQRSRNNLKYLGSTQYSYYQKIHGDKENYQSRNILYASNDVHHDIKASEKGDNIKTISKREQIKTLFRRLWLKMPFIKADDNPKEVEDIHEIQSVIDPIQNSMLDTASSDGQDNVNSTILQDSQLVDVNIEVYMDSSTNTNATSGTNQEHLSTELESSNTLDTPIESPPSIISTVDLSGTWKPKVTNQFKSEYDEYLLNCSQSFMFRKVIVNGIALQKEIIQQHGNDLQITATNPAGNWDRTLVYNETISIKDPDGDLVTVESVWEDKGRVHRSWLRNKPRVHGGVFDTRRYLDSDVDELVCESQFIPAAGSEDRFQFGHVIWRFERC